MESVKQYMKETGKVMSDNALTDEQKLLPFAIGIVLGIFGIAKLIAVLMKKWKGRTYCGILGMVAASPVVILMDKSIYAGFNWIICVASVAALAVGVLIAMKLGGDPEPAKE